MVCKLRVITALTDRIEHRVAIAGSGPAAFFTADALLSRNPHLQVHIFERLPVPFGLVRYGVAPDQQNIKAVTRKFHTVAERKGFFFHGNVGVGVDVAVDDLAAHFDAVVLACGASTSRDLGIRGEGLTGSYSAEVFTGWYNGHPAHASLAPDLRTRDALIVGQGNVALDVARILAAGPEALRDTDIPERAWSGLEQSSIQTLHVVGRRGPAEAAFSMDELEALSSLDGCELVVAEEAWLREESGSVAEALRELAARPPASPARRIVFHFLRSPVEITGQHRVEGVVLGKNVLSGPAGARTAEPLNDTIRIPCGLVIRCVGFRADPIPGVPFDEALGILPNEAGRVVAPGVPGRLYAAGWIKHGPQGLIGTARRDARETAGTVLADLALPGARPRAGGAIALLDRLREQGVRMTSWDDWLRIDTHERAAGESKGKAREKLVSVEEMLEVAGRGSHV